MRKYYYFIIAPLLISLFIYLFYRTEKTVVNELVIRLFSFDTYATVKKKVNLMLPLNELVIYSLPEGLWIFCITVTSNPYYIGQGNWRINCVIFPLLYCVGLEIGQLLHFTNGRFDAVDILVSVGFWLIAISTFDEKLGRQNILSPFNRERLVCFISYGIVYLSHVLT